MFLRQLFLGFIGLCAGGVVAAGVFAFIAMIGIFPRIISKTDTAKHIFLYESVMVIGGTAGNIMDLYEIPVLFGGNLFLCICGLSVGIFVGCLVMSLAETLKAVPVMNRRVHLAVGIQYIILSLALGKLTGSLIFFYQGIGQ